MQKKQTTNSLLTYLYILNINFRNILKIILLLNLLLV